MSLEQQEMLDVMSLADGELDGEALARTEKLVEENAEAKELLASLRAIGDGVRSVASNAIDVRDAVMGKIAPNDLDKARIKRTARTRMAVVSVALVALAAGVMFYVRDQQSAPRVATVPADSSSSSGEAILASAAATGVQVDFVDTPTAVSVFYLPAQTTGAESKTTETPPTTVVWVDDSMVANPP